MAKRDVLRKVLGIIIWLTGVIVSISVAYGMTQGILSLPIWLGGVAVAKVVGWIVFVTTLVGVALAIIDYLS